MPWLFRLAPIFLVAACSQNLPSVDAGVDLGTQSDPCVPNRCEEAHRTICVAPMGVAECRCDPGHEEQAGQCVPSTSCTPDTCGGHGTCSLGASGPVCACELGWSGAYCEACNAAAGYYSDGHGGCTLDACTPNPCTDPVRSQCTVVNQKAVCSCMAGTHDENGACIADTMCLSTTCDGHGACADGGGAPHCTCDEGWTGARCDQCNDALGYHSDGAGGCTTNPCLPNPCAMPLRSVCTSDGAVTSCTCDPGAHADGDVCVVDETCGPSTCSGHGACAVMGGLARCTCDDGWSGGACDACAFDYHSDGAGGCTTDVCLPNPCNAPNQTTCVAAGTTPTCTCDGGTHPDGTGGCTSDPCKPDPCVASNQACKVVGVDAVCYVPDCSDGNPCTDDAVVGGGCQHTPRNSGACTTSICLVGETCTAGLCGGGSPRVCDDGNPCTKDTCVAPTGCVASNDDTLVPPNDAFDCTVAKCVSGASQQVPTDARCDDGKWCTGEDACAPGAGADGRGCVVRNVPQAPPATACSPYVCDNALKQFVAQPLNPGDSCNDGIACTSGDICDANGLCAGALSSLCEAPDASCTPSGSLSTDVDIGVATVTGTVTQNHDTLPLTTTNYENGVIWARARDTGKLHRLLLIDWTRNGSYPNYTRSAGADKINTTLVPGIYDILYQRAYQSSGDFVEEQTRTPAPDAVVNGYRLLQSLVVIPRGGRTLDVDIGVTAVTGTVTQNHDTLPMTTTNYENGVIWARAKDTGKLHRLLLIDWTRNGSYPNYTRSPGADQINTTLIPGAYDILYQRAYQDSGDFVEEQTRTPTPDAVVNGYRLLMENVTISGASQKMDVDIGVTAVTGTVTQNLATLPMTTTNYENGVIWARARDTGKLHRLLLIDWTRNGSYPNYTRSPGADQINTTLIPGAYDILYQRAYQSSGDFVEEQTRTPTPDAVVNGYRLLMENVTISGASKKIDIDIGVTALTGTVTQNTATLPMTTTNYENGVIWARAKDTGKLHRLLLIDWTRNGSYPNYTRSPGADQINTTLIPGAYDILYQRAYEDSGDFVEEQTRTPTPDAVVNGYRLLMENVAISGSSQKIDVDIGVTAVTGTVTQNHATLPMTTTNYENGVIWARAKDTGKLHRLLLIDWTRNGSYPNYTRSPGADKINTTLIPGTYDILYQRAYQDSGDFVEEQTRTPTPDAVVNGYRLLMENVTISGAAQTLDVNIPVVTVSGVITMNGATLPMTTTNYENGVLWLRARDTGKLHRIALMDWTRNGSYPNYTRSPASDHFTTTMVPGAYDLLYQRAYQSSGDFVEEQTRTPTPDPVVNGYRSLQACILVQ